MITLDIMLPYYDSIMKISCDEDTITDTLMEKLKLCLSEDPSTQRPWLCDIRRRQLLLHDHTLAECGLMDGSPLIMV